MCNTHDTIDAILVARKLHHQGSIVNIPHSNVGLMATLPGDHVVAILGEVQRRKSLPAGVRDEELPVLSGIVKDDGTPTQRGELKTFIVLHFAVKIQENIKKKQLRKKLRSVNITHMSFFEGKRSAYLDGEISSLKTKKKVQCVLLF